MVALSDIGVAFKSIGNVEVVKKGKISHESKILPNDIDIIVYFISKVKGSVCHNNLFRKFEEFLEVGTDDDQIQVDECFHVVNIR